MTQQIESKEERISRGKFKLRQLLTKMDVGAPHVIDGLVEVALCSKVFRRFVDGHPVDVATALFGGGQVPSYDTAFD